MHFFFFYTKTVFPKHSTGLFISKAKAREDIKRAWRWYYFAIKDSVLGNFLWVFKLNFGTEWKTGSLMLHSAKLRSLSINLDNHQILTTHTLNEDPNCNIHWAAEHGSAWVIVQELTSFLHVEKLSYQRLQRARGRAVPWCWWNGCASKTFQGIYTCSRLRFLLLS